MSKKELSKRDLAAREAMSAEAGIASQYGAQVAFVREVYPKGYDPDEAKVAVANALLKADLTPAQADLVALLISKKKDGTVSLRSRYPSGAEVKGKMVANRAISLYSRLMEVCRERKPSNDGDGDDAKGPTPKQKLAAEIAAMAESENLMRLTVKQLESIKDSIVKAFQS